MDGIRQQRGQSSGEPRRHGLGQDLSFPRAAGDGGAARPATSGFHPLAVSVALIVAAGIIAGGFALDDGSHEGRQLAFSLIAGALFGWTLQRSRFCFFCLSREYLEERDARGVLGLVLALAAGTIGYHAVFGAFLPEPSPGRLPPGAHIGPVGLALALGAFAFGAGMAVSGSCISAHLYRLGEGSIASIVALFGAALGFVFGFQTWNLLYLRAIQEAPVVWLPQELGYGGSLLVQLGLLAALALLLARRLPRTATATTLAPPPAGLLQAVLVCRWPVWAGGLVVAFLGTIAYLRVAPLGVTAELGSLARTAAQKFEWIPTRIEGLDTFRGCATAIKEGLLSNNGVFVLGLVGASLAAALVAGQFRLRIPGAVEWVRNLVGGILMGWGAMIALGCTVGTLLSGISAGALSGWVFALFCFAGLWIALKLRRRFES